MFKIALVTRLISVADIAEGYLVGIDSSLILSPNQLRISIEIPFELIEMFLDMSDTGSNSVRLVSYLYALPIVADIFSNNLPGGNRYISPRRFSSNC